MQLFSSESKNDLPSGFRLARLEVCNWGTFDRKIWEILPQGKNALLTGDIGSGKSTLVDAITTLLVPQRKITYNKAAGAASRERSLRSYVKGAFRNEKVNHSSQARDVYLRPNNDLHSVVLGVFVDRKRGETISLAQVFWMKDEDVKRIHAIGTRDMTIDPDFSEFGSQPLHLKRALDRDEAVRTFPSFSSYSDYFRKLFGIAQPEALDLFYQTVSMKSVGNLTDFVRDHMLGETGIQAEIQTLVDRYQNLSEAHAAVERAREQIKLLEPVAENGKRYKKATAELAEYERMLDEIPQVFAHRQASALQRTLRELHDQFEERELARNELVARIETQRKHLNGLERQRDQLGASVRLREIEITLTQLEKTRAQRTIERDRYHRLRGQLNQAQKEREFSLDAPEDVDQFQENRRTLEVRHSLLEDERVALRNQKPELHVALDKLQQQRDDLAAELASLKARKTQIPRHNLNIRQKLLEALELDESDVPFAGELLRVRDEERSWEGAIERQLRGLGLSLLVDESLYHAVSDYVDSHHLKGKLVYLRTQTHPTERYSEEPTSDSLVYKVEVRPDSPFCDWLETELRRRYDFSCCDTIEAFRRAQRGITRAGQSKSGRWQHVKDDRYAIDDRRQYVLGWNNLRKIEAVAAALEAVQADWERVQQQLDALETRERQLDERMRLIEQLLRFESFADLNVAAVATEIAALTTERARLLDDSKELHEIEREIETTRQQIRTFEGESRQFDRDMGALDAEIFSRVNQFSKHLETLDINPPETARPDGDSSGKKAWIEAYLAVDLPEIALSGGLQILLEKQQLKLSQAPDTLARQQRQLVDALQGTRGLMARARDRITKYEKAVVFAMKDFRDRYPSETRDADASIDSLGDFETMYTRLLDDDLPRHEREFHKMLEVETIRSIAIFKSKLEDYEKDVLDKIRQINQHLHEIDYNPERYIQITPERVSSTDVLEFKQQLRACLEGIIAEENLYSEEKFNRVRHLLERFRSGAPEDVRWTGRVTDVRQWYSFGAEELYREDNQRYEYFSDSSGKSGGQKEKLAYTILASAIAFQFGLGTRSRSFRFVVIDEAFGRGSDESTRYGLRLFEKMNLQLLIVTPLQKINVIEDYVSSVHYVSNPTGKDSKVRNLSIAEYHVEKAARLVEITPKP